MPQTQQIRRLQRQISDSREALVRERHRANLYQQQLEQLLAANKQPPSPQPPAADDAAHDDCVMLTRQQYELLLLKDRAMNAVQEGITIADCSQPDMPLIYVNQGFEKITGASVGRELQLCATPKPAVKASATTGLPHCRIFNTCRADGAVCVLLVRVTAGPPPTSISQCPLIGPS